MIGPPTKKGARRGALSAARWPMGLSKPGRCFTKQTGDMVYTMAENSWLSQLWLDARRCVYALERDSNRGPTPAVSIELSEGRRKKISVTDLCHVMNSAPRVRTAYKLIKRYEEVGPSAYSTWGVTRLLQLRVFCLGLF